MVPTTLTGRDCAVSPPDAEKPWDGFLADILWQSLDRRFAERSFLHTLERPPSIGSGVDEYVDRAMKELKIPPATHFEA